MIIKIQWPIIPPDAELFAYSAPGPAQQHWMIPQTALPPDTLDRIEADCKKGGGKAYYEATNWQTSKHKWPKIGKRVEPQNW